MKDIDYVYEGSRRSSKSEIDLLIQELRDTIDNQRETIEQLENIRKEAIEMFKDSNLNKYYHGMSYEFEINDFRDDLLNILNKGSD